MFETAESTERVILLGVELPSSQNFDMSMLELASLAQTAGAEVVRSYRQKRDKYDSKSFVGSGKLQEIAAMIEADQIDMVIVNNRLTPRQNSNLEQAFGVKVIDRMQLILDIFAMRARSHEGKLQVHLAQLKYMLPRLAGQGVMLSRQAGGIGSRGPGESQLELNRRSIRHQISDIERQLKIVEKTRSTIRDKRLESTVFKIGLIGYTNAGKSTLMNRLAGKKIAVVGNKPGVTKGQQWLKSNKDLEILDTPGILWPKFEDETVALKLALTGAIKDNLLPMDEVTIFGLNYFKTHYPEKLQERFKQMNLDDEAPEIIMDMTRILGFRDDYDRFYNLFVKEVRDGKLGNYTLDTLDDLNAND